MSSKLLALSRFHRPLSCRSQLIVALLITMVPLFIFAVVMIYLFAQNNKVTFQRGASERTLALLTAVDTGLKSSITTLQALATSGELESDDLNGFRDDAARVLKSQPDWFNINLSATSGQQVMNLLRPPGAVLPMTRERRSFEEVLRTGKAAVGHLIRGPVTDKYEFSVRVPIIQNGVIKYVLSAVVNPSSINALLDAQRLPPNWFGGVLDGNNRVVARTVNPAQSLGELASESLQRALARSSEGWFYGHTIEGAEVYTPYNRSAFSGWTVAIGIPAEAVEASFHRSLLYVASFGVMFLAVGVALAWFVSTRTSRSIRSLASVASDLGLGRKAANKNVPDRIAEVEQVKESLLNAGQLIQERSEERDRVEGALRQVTERLELAQEASNIGTFERDLITDKIKWSTSQEKLYGLTPGSFSGKHEEWARHVHPEDIEAVAAAIVRAKETKGSINIEFRVIHPDGTVRWLESQARVFADDKGTPRRMLGVNIDITAHKLAEQRLQLQSAASRILAESQELREAAPKMVQALCELTGWDIGAIWEVDRRANELTCVDVWHLPSIAVSEFEATTRQRRFAPGIGLVGRVWSGGQATWLSDVSKDNNFPRAPAALEEGLHAGVCFPIKLGAEILGVIECYSREIREPDDDFLQMLESIGSQLGQFIERKRAETELIALKDHLATDLQAMSLLHEFGTRCAQPGADIDDCLGALVETAIAVTHANKGNIQLLDTPSGTLKLMAHRGFSEPFLNYFAAVRDQSSACGGAMQLCERIMVEDVTQSPIFAGTPALDVLLQADVRAVQSTPLMSSAGRLLGMISTHFSKPRRLSDRDLRMIDLLARQAGDFLERKQTEESLRDADRRKDEFLAVLGHELRNPLGVISNVAQLIRKKKVWADSGLEELEDTMTRQVGQMARLLDDLLDVSRIGRGQIRLKKEPCDFTEIVRKIAEDHRRLLKENGLMLATEISDEPLWVMGDRTRLSQVVGNALYNANKFTDSGGSVTIRLTKREQACLLTVRDTGIGMEPEILARAFEPFSQADHSIDRSRGGLGLGLALVKGLVELQEGNVAIGSDGTGLGVELTIRFPLIEAPTQATKPVEPAHDGARPCRILIIEDNVVAAKSTGMFLSATGHAVEIAHDGETGIEIARRFRPEVVLCDIGLPVMDGYAVSRALRQEPGLSDAYLIAITGYGREEDERRARDVGFDAHLTKPVNLEELERLLSEFTAQEAKAAM